MSGVLIVGYGNEYAPEWRHYQQSREFGTILSENLEIARLVTINFLNDKENQHLIDDGKLVTRFGVIALAHLIALKMAQAVE